MTQALEHHWPHIDDLDKHQGDDIMATHYKASALIVTDKCRCSHIGHDHLWGPKQCRIQVESAKRR